MEIINLIEKEVRRVVNQMCDELEQSNPETAFCTSHLCRLDVTCYVLNRIAPRYVTSSRGAAHAEHDYLNNPQLEIDIMRLANEGLRRVTTVQRGYYSYGDTGESQQRGPAFNFPTIVGRLLNGQNFAPVADIEVSLRGSDGLVEMIDPRWPNPYRIDETTAGCFSFWPKPLAAESYDDQQVFDFELVVETSGFEPFHHYFTLELDAEEGAKQLQRLSQDFTLGELYLIPADSDDEPSA